MIDHMRQPASLRRLAMLGVLLLGVLASSMAGFAQELKEVQAPPSSLVLKSRGSFIVGGDSVVQPPAQLSSFTDQPLDSGGHVTINQMYVEYMVPTTDNGIPVVMLHGATLSGKSYDTTPDGRMGWYEYFVRQGHPVYVPDQVSRARSGVDIATYNEVRAGVQPVSALPNFWRFPDELVWTQFRFGPTFGTAFPDGQFPVEAVGELSRQAIPDFNTVLPTPNPNIAAMANLAAQLNSTVLLGHSQTGSLPLDAALAHPNAVKAVVLVEPGLPGDPVDRRGDRDPGDEADPGGIRRQPRCADRYDCQLAVSVQRLPGLHRARQCHGRRRGDAASARPGHPREQPHDHAGQEQPPDRRPDPPMDQPHHVGRRSRPPVSAADRPRGRYGGPLRPAGPPPLSAAR